ncbi:hypothetical protein [Leptolyngbya sp. FACHB-261]|uniref:hypothetical protein n=1 Tax=Leptolyngbya sp. FACHB-261 TaxID=2692806 RepID=UPI001689D401|nr:hypothetical protein [Leptolyngbya sp. FACHB-261]MBD2101185.1 hypothetical protein [Leptolyngbya sp. FACHB-261]
MACNPIQTQWLAVSQEWHEKHERLQQGCRKTEALRERLAENSQVSKLLRKELAENRRRLAALSQDWARERKPTVVARIVLLKEPATLLAQAVDAQQTATQEQTHQAEQIEFEYRGYSVRVENTLEGWQSQINQLLLPKRETAAEALFVACNFIDYCSTNVALKKLLSGLCDSGVLGQTERINLMASFRNIVWKRNFV